MIKKTKLQNIALKKLNKSVVRKEALKLLKQGTSIQEAISKSLKLLAEKYILPTHAPQKIPQTQEFNGR